MLFSLGDLLINLLKALLFYEPYLISLRTKDGMPVLTERQKKSSILDSFKLIRMFGGK